MTRYINADALKIQIACVYGSNPKYLNWLNNAPTVDAVPVIRCKDCKWFGKIGCAVNIVDESDEPEEDDFCSWGERKEE